MEKDELMHLSSQVRDYAMSKQIDDVEVQNMSHEKLIKEESKDSLQQLDPNWLDRIRKYQASSSKIAPVLDKPDLPNDQFDERMENLKLRMAKTNLLSELKSAHSKSQKYDGLKRSSKVYQKSLYKNDGSLFSD